MILHDQIISRSRPAILTIRLAASVADRRDRCQVDAWRLPNRIQSTRLLSFLDPIELVVGFPRWLMVIDLNRVGSMDITDILGGLLKRNMERGGKGGSAMNDMFKRHRKQPKHYKAVSKRTTVNL